MMRLVVLLSTLFFSAKIALADASVTFLIDENRYMPRHVAVRVVKEALALFPFRVRHRLLVSPKNSCSRVTTEDGVQLYCYMQVKRAAGIRGRALFLSEPTIIGDQIYTEGRAQVCLGFATGVCNITESNASGLPRVEYAIIACAHELAHEFGAYHDPRFYKGCPSIMYEAPFPYVEMCPPLRFSKVSVKQMNRCLKQ